MKPTYKTLKSLCAATLLGCALLVVAGCKSVPAPPTAEDAEATWRDINKQSGMDGDLALVSLTKTDGQMAEVQGTKVYTFFYEVKEKHLTKLGNWQPGQIETVKSNYGFQLTEKGWQGPTGRVFPK